MDAWLREFHGGIVATIIYVTKLDTELKNFKMLANIDL